MYERGNYPSFKEKFKAADWNSILALENVDVIAASISEIILQNASLTIPNKYVTLRPDDIPWMNNSIRKLIRKRKFTKRRK